MFFSAFARKRIQCGRFHPLVGPRATISRYITEHDAHPKSFIWAYSSITLAKISECSV